MPLNIHKTATRQDNKTILYQGSKLESHTPERHLEHQVGYINPAITL